MKILSRVTIVLLLLFVWEQALGEKIDINTAPLEDLVKIIHIGETRAKELISLRPFSSLDELTKIKGIGESKLKDIKEQGLAWVAPELKVETPLKAETENLIAKFKSQQSYPSGIVINEILPSPEGPDEENEWIEIFNQNNFEVDLSGWQIADKMGETRIYIFDKETKISPNGYLVLLRPVSKITLNNENDGLSLIRPDGKIIDSVNYQKAIRGQSYNRKGLAWFWSSVLTPGSLNVTLSEQTIQSESKINGEKSKIQIEENQNFQTKQGLASAAQQTPTRGKFLYAFIIALTIAIFSVIIILIIKKKINKFPRLWTED